MKTKYLLFTICIWLAGITNALAQQNTITIPDVSVTGGHSISLPVNMDNTTDIVAVQFTLTLPDGLSLETSSATPTERADDHTLTFRSIGANRYMAMFFSPGNKAVKGRTGKIMSVNLKASDQLREGTELPLTLSDVIMGSRDGSNIVTSFSSGKVTIDKSADLEVSHVQTSATVVNPGEKINVSWTVSNIGGISTSAGWSEHIFLMDEHGTEKHIATLYHDEILNVGGEVSRSAELNLPYIIGMDGNCHIVVKVVPNSDCGEPSWLQSNNIAETSSIISVKKNLILSPEIANIEESSAKAVRFQLSRSGSTTSDETFSLTRNADERITFQENITIEKGKSSIYFYAQVAANKVLDNDSIVRFTLSGNDYPEASSVINIEDDTNPSLSISTQAQDVTEGGSIMFTISTQRVSKSDINVMMTCDFTSRFNIPSNIVIPAGKASVDVTVNAVEDEKPNAEEMVTFTVTAAKHNPASLYTVLVDNDIPTLQLEITPTAISESAGPLSITAKLRRTDNIDKVITVKFSDDSDGNIYYDRQTITLDKGVAETTVNLGPIDNTIVEGERTYNISAAVWIASCSCNANNGSSGGVVTVPLTVYDNDGPTLTLTSTASILNEGSEIILTVKRNTATTSPLNVNISSDHDSYIEYPKTVTIPAGQSETSFTVKSKKNETTGDGFTATLSATADGFATGNVWFVVSDQTLPDAQVKSFTATESDFIHGDKISFNATITNSGNAILPTNTLVQLFMSGSQNAVADIYTEYAIQTGNVLDVNFNIKGEFNIGQHSFYIKVNPNKTCAELDYNNNLSALATINILSPFSTTTQIEKSIVAKNEEIDISGKATGRNVTNSDIDIYVINRGYRQVITTKTDAEGLFSIKYKPFENQSGHFVVGSCFHGDNRNEEQCSFDIFDIDVKNSSLTCDVNRGDTFNGKFFLTNNGILPITNVKARPLSTLPNVEITISDTPIRIDGGTSKELTYTIKGIETSPEIAWQTIKTEFTCDEGATATSDINLYIREPLAKLKSDIATINTTVAIGSNRDYHLTLTNIGRSETGTITLAAPSWIRLDGIQHINSLATGESAEVALIINTTEQMQANVPITGNIGINCEKGNGINIPFNIEPVSSQLGVLSVDVCDEFTYYTSEAPHVSGASITVKHPTTGALITMGTTNENGIFEAELPEGYYAITVSANKHETRSNFIYVDPERTHNIVINLGYTAVTYNWTVEETQVKDEYKLATKVSYETNVPVPCVIMECPEGIDGDNMKVGESTIVNITITNKGLITALNTTLILPENTNEWQFEALTNIEPFSLASQQAVIVPLRITRVSDGRESLSKGRSLPNNFHNCMAQASATYESLCGHDIRKNEAILRMSLKMCAIAATGATILQYANGNAAGNTGTPPLGGIVSRPNEIVTDRDNYTMMADQTLYMCNPCEAERGEDLINVLIGRTWLGGINDFFDGLYNILSPRHREQYIVTISRRALSEFRNQLNRRNTPDYIDEIIAIIDASTRRCSVEPTQAKALKAGQMSWKEEYNEMARLEVEYLKNINNILTVLFGDRTWLGTDIDNKLAFIDAVAENENLTDEEVLSLRPTSVTDEQALKLYKRINGLDKENYIDAKTFDKLIDSNMQLNEAAVAKGFESVFDGFSKTCDVCVEKYREKSSSVCASITLQFSQNMVMTRQAFRGTLTVFNGNETTAMTDVKLNLVVKDEMGNVATSHEFQITPETLKGFNGNMNLEEGWTLNAQQTGVATILFIPTKNAAPSYNTLYYFGGSLSYVDPFTGLAVTRDLTPIPLYVKPSPSLDLTYFLQRDIKGDDPLTVEVEPSEEAEFALLINNSGFGDATEVIMHIEEPKIIDNEKGLNVNFKLMSSQLNGGDRKLALGGSVATDFGTIPAKSTSYAQWWMKSSLLGHFTTYNVEATHVTSYSNPDLSLLNDVSIHELIRSINVETDGKKYVGFMTNDITDADDTPDMLYLSNGEIESVSVVKDAQIHKISTTEYALNIAVAHNGWWYGNITDPTYGMSELKSVIRQSDGKEMPIRNFWQTDRTLRDGKDPLYENRIHFVDNINTANDDTYILTFEPAPELLLDVVSIEGVPEEGSLSVEPLSSVKVVFNKNIDPTTFTTDDIHLAVQGINKDVSAIDISTEDNKTFSINFSAINENIGNGYFVFKVNTSDITDTEGFQGKNGKQVEWIMFRDGLVSLTTATYPLPAGTIQKVSDSSSAKAVSAKADDNKSAEYGSTVKLITVPNEGYKFKNWTVNGEVVSTDTILEYMALSDMDVKANYSLNTYPVTISAVGGSVSGSASGIYSFGDVLTVTAMPDEDYVFTGWTINGKNCGTDVQLQVTVVEAKEIKAAFSRDLLQQSLVFSRGWNWVSSYISEPIPIGKILGNIDSVISQNDKIILDPQLGMIGGIEALAPGVAYKMNASYNTLKTFKGHLHNLTTSPIELLTGWNWISYPYLEEKNINDILPDVTEGDYITSQFGFSEYADGYWEGTLNVLSPGMGYIYKSNTDKTLAFDFTEKSSTEYNTDYYSNNSYHSDINIHKYPSTMNIIANISANGYGVDESESCIYAFVGDECRGESQYVGGKHYLTIYGDEATIITFVIEDTNSGNTYVAKENVTFGQQILGSRKSPFTITLSGATGMNKINGASGKMKVYSIEGMLINPEATIDKLKKLDSGIYIVNGEKFVVK